jgi:nucleotide-binding universal stress UspA family protein
MLSHLIASEEGYVFANTGAPRRVGKFRAGLAPRSGASSGFWGNPASVQVVSRSEELDMVRGGGYDFLAAEYSQDLAQEYIAARINRAGEYLKEAAMRLESGGIKTETVVREGAAAENIVQYAQENGIDLIIMSTRGQGGIQRFLLGSTTDRVLRTGHLPVLVVPPEE